MRILHIAPYSPAAWAYGGIPRVVAALTRGLADLGHTVAISATDAVDGETRLEAERGVSGGAPHPPRYVDGIEWRIFPNVSNRAAYHLQAFAPIGFSAFLAEHLTSYDIVHLHACHNVLGLLAARQATDAGVRWVISPNGTAPMFERRIWAKRLLWRLGAERALRDASRVLAVSAAEEAQLAEMGVPVRLIRRVPNALDVPALTTPDAVTAIRRRREANAEPVVLFIGKITPRKHVDVVVEAFARLPYPRARLVLAGNDLGGLRAAVQRTRALGLEARTEVRGLLRGTERLQAMADADLVVYPSSNEVFGLVPCEALLLGTPVIVGNDSGCAEVVGPDGVIAVTPDDPGGLAAAMAHALRQDADWRRSVWRGRERMRTRYNATVVARSLESVYREVLVEKEGRRTA